MKKHITFISIMVILLLLGMGSFVSADEFISIGTSTVGGTMNIVGMAMANIINTSDIGLKANIELTGGSSENALLVGKGRVEFALSASDILYEAARGIQRFENDKMPDVRGVMGGAMNILHIYTHQKSGIDSVYDLKGKRISIGAPGSIVNAVMDILMDVYGFTMNEDWFPEYLGHSDGAEALKDGNVDAVVIISTVPTSPVAMFSTTHDIKILSLEEDKLNELLAKNPYWVKGSIPAGVYRGVDDEVTNIFGVATVMITNKNVSDDIVYNVTKALVERSDDLVEAHSSGVEWTLENALRGIEGVLPLHPGAEKYFKEIGVL